MVAVLPLAVLAALLAIAVILLVLLPLLVFVAAAALLLLVAVRVLLTLLTLLSALVVAAAAALLLIAITVPFVHVRFLPTGPLERRSNKGIPIIRRQQPDHKGPGPGRKRAPVTQVPDAR